MACLNCNAEVGCEFDFCSIECEESFEAKQNQDELDESMDGDHESALESVYGPMDEGQYEWETGGDEW